MHKNLTLNDKQGAKNRNTKMKDHSSDAVVSSPLITKHASRTRIKYQSVLIVTGTQEKQTEAVRALINGGLAQLFANKLHVMGHLTEFHSAIERRDGIIRSNR